MKTRIEQFFDEITDILFNIGVSLFITAINVGLIYLIILGIRRIMDIL